MNNERMPKQIANARMKGIRKRGRPQKRWTDEGEKDLKICEYEIGMQWPKAGRNGQGCIGSQGAQ
jgi:hypothetical protein